MNSARFCFTSWYFDCEKNSESATARNGVSVSYARGELVEVRRADGYLRDLLDVERVVVEQTLQLELAVFRFLRRGERREYVFGFHDRALE